MRQFILDHLEPFLRQIQAIGGESSELIIEPPVTEAELDSIEKGLDKPIPEDLRRFATTASRKIWFYWELPDGFDLPEPLQEVFGGGFDFDITALPKLEAGRAGWQADVFPDPDNAYDRVWHHKLGFHVVENGDYLAFDPSGRVIYLSHDDGEGHGYVMAPSFTELMTRWVPLGCPGPEGWQWIGFTSSETSGILADTEQARDWLKAVGI